MLDLTKNSLFDMDFGELRSCDAENPPRESLELYIKSRPRGPGDVADFVYSAHELPVRVYGILVTRGRPEIAELELWTLTWREGAEGTQDEYETEAPPKPAGSTPDRPSQATCSGASRLDESSPRPKANSPWTTGARTASRSSV